MTKRQFTRSDRRAILVLIGVMVLSTIIIEFREPRELHRTYKSFNRDSLALQHQIDSARRAARYQAVKDSYALLKQQREQRKHAREMAYQAMMDSFARLKANQLKEKEERLEQRNRYMDSLRSLRPVKLLPGETIELNQSDTLQLQRIPGIGIGFAKKIIHYRQNLGGFFNSSQLMEIEGIPASVINYVHISDSPRKTISINSSTLNQLRNHPYINYYQAKAIIDYRKKYGKIKDVSQLSLIDSFSEEDIQKLKHYILY